MMPSVNVARLFAVCFAALSLAGIGSAAALDYPTRPVRWIVPYTPGGATDITARIVAQWLSERMGQQFFIENKPGAGNNIGTEAMIHSPADGYTLLLVNPANAINTTLYPKLGFNLLRDSAPVRNHARAERHGGQSGGAGQDGCRVHRLCQGQPGQDQLGDVGQRHLGASLG
jgi:tripartite-type tricarboxylate transporter receptor subunit TctC